MHTFPNCLLSPIMKDNTVRLLLCAGLLSLSFLTGCIQVEETITLNADGSGTMELAYSVAEEQAVLGVEHALAELEDVPAGERHRAFDRQRRGQQREQQDRDEGEGGFHLGSFRRDHTSKAPLGFCCASV